MRISDWSSDVCSSDLLVEEFLLTNRAPSLDVLKAQSLPRIEAIYGQLDDEAVRNLLEVRPEYIETYIATVEDAHGTLDRYLDRKSTRLNSSHSCASRMPSSA